MKFKKNITLTFLILGIGNVFAQNSMPGLDYLGRGYNIFGKYANPDDCKAQLFDFNTTNTVQTGGQTYYLPTFIEYLVLQKKNLKQFPEKIQILT